MDPKGTTYVSNFLLSGTSESSASSSLLHLSSIVDSITNDEKIKLPADVSES